MSVILTINIYYYYVFNYLLLYIYYFIYNKYLLCILLVNNIPHVLVSHMSIVANSTLFSTYIMVVLYTEYYH